MGDSNQTMVDDGRHIARTWYADLCAPRPVLVVISGPSGVGKDATIQLVKERGYPCYFVVTATTRPSGPVRWMAWTTTSCPRLNLGR